MLEIYQMIELSENVKKSNYSATLAKNLKKYRLKYYNEYKALNKIYDNPYSSQNIAVLLNISKRHYNRLENPNDTVKNITLEKLLILSKIYNISLDDFFNN